MEDKLLNSFLAQQKEPLNKKNPLTCYYSTYLRSLLVIATTTQGVRFYPKHYQISGMQSGYRIKNIRKKHLLSQVQLKKCIYYRCSI